jgi:single-strand DNA-binding protein
MLYWQQPNTVIMGGRITDDLTIKEFKMDSKVLEFSIANNLRSSGESRESKGHYFRCEAWGKTAEIIQQHFKKGDGITVVGSLHWNSWADKTTGTKRESTKIRVESFHFGDQPSKSENTSPPPALKVYAPYPPEELPSAGAPNPDDIPF